MYLKTRPTTDGLLLKAKGKNVFKTVSRKQLAVSGVQRGWLMPVAAFIVVVMGLLAAGMGLVSSQTSIANAQEQISLQAFYAAEAGAQFGMNQLFYATASTISRASATTACNSITASDLVFSAAGMQNCRATITCQVNIDGADTTSFFQINSAGSCGFAPVSAQRTVDVSAFLQ